MTALEPHDLDRLPDPWRKLRQSTPSRVGLGRSGDTMPLDAVLAFQLAHAQARDAVEAELDVDALRTQLAPRDSLVVASCAPDRPTYLKRPDLGRRLGDDGRAILEAARGTYDCVFVVADGLSAMATQKHAIPLVEACLPLLDDLNMTPIVVATQARVALGDEIGAVLGAAFSVVLIGERPGLTVADSLGAYLTFAPRQGRRDSERNCISNIHDRGGLSYALAARKLAWLVRAGRRIGATGVALKDAEGLPSPETVPSVR